LSDANDLIRKRQTEATSKHYNNFIRATIYFAVFRFALSQGEAKELEEVCAQAIYFISKIPSFLW